MSAEKAFPIGFACVVPLKNQQLVSPLPAALSRSFTAAEAPTDTSTEGRGTCQATAHKRHQGQPVDVGTSRATVAALGGCQDPRSTRTPAITSILQKARIPASVLTAL